MYYETLVALHGVLDRHPWTEHVTCDDHGSELFGLAMNRSDAYGWYSTGGWTYPYRGWGEARIVVQDPGRWADCGAGGDWTQDGRVRELAWMSADIPLGVREPRLPVLPVAELAGDASDALAAMRRWFALADPSRSVPVSVTVADGPALPEKAAAVRDAMRGRLGDVADVEVATGEVDLSGLADVHGERGYNKSRERGVLRLACRTREWSPEVAVWLVETVGDALRAVGHAERAIVTASSSSAAPPPAAGAC